MFFHLVSFLLTYFCVSKCSVWTSLALIVNYKFLLTHIRLVWFLGIQETCQILTTTCDSDVRTQTAELWHTCKVIVRCRLLYFLSAKLIFSNLHIIEMALQRAICVLSVCLYVGVEEPLCKAVNNIWFTVLLVVHSSGPITVRSPTSVPTIIPVEDTKHKDKGSWQRLTDLSSAHLGETWGKLGNK